MCGAISMSIAKPSAPPRKSRGSGPIVVPETVVSFPVRDDTHLDRVRVVAGRAVPLLDDVDPPLGCEQRGVDDVHDLVNPLLERAVERGGREEPRVVLGEAVRGQPR